MRKSRKKLLKLRIQKFLFSASLGLITGLFVWLFYFVLIHAHTFVWKTLPAVLALPKAIANFYPLMVCIPGGLLLSYLHTRTGNGVKSSNETIVAARRRGYTTGSLGYTLLFALLPLILGACAGPEAGLVAMLAALASTLEPFTQKYSRYKDKRRISAYAVLSSGLSTAFLNPFMGLVDLFESRGPEDDRLSVRNLIKGELFCCLITTLTAIVAFKGLSALLPWEGIAFQKAIGPGVGLHTLIYVGPAVLAGCGVGTMFWVFMRGVRKTLRPLKKHPAVLSVLCGVCMGLLAMYAPLLVFTGEAQAVKAFESFLSLGAPMLLLLAVAKLFFLNLCNACGWNGGGIMPGVFSGICAGLACAAWFPGVSPVFAAAVGCAACMGVMLRKPLTVTVLMVTFFPTAYLPYMLFAAFVGSNIPVPFHKMPKTNG